MLKHKISSLSLIIIAVSLFITGCGNSLVKGDKEYTYTLNVKKSPTNVTAMELTSTAKEMSLGSAITELKNSGQQIALADETTEYMRVTEMLGVINTQGKQWHAYVNNTKIEDTNLGVAIKPDDNIEWKYE
ncbi:MAG: hypothetical protein WCW16_00405 [Candidatus Magasanikbacteria bacterium]